MQYRYFECKCGHTFHAFAEFSTVGSIETYKTGTYKITGSSKPLTHKCEKCGEEAPLNLNDPESAGTKLLFNYMER